MSTTITPFPVSRRPGRAILRSVTALFIASLTYPAVGQETQGFSCSPNTVQSFVVPTGVTEITANVQGAHGSYPDHGASGGFGGLVQANLSVFPGQTLYIWVGCLAQDNLAWGYGDGGSKGGASEAGGDGGYGGGGSAVTDDPLGQAPLLVAGGGGGGGGNGLGGASNEPGGQGGNGGLPAENGQDGASPGEGSGGLINQGDGISGGDGTGASTDSGAGGGGGGGGGYLGGGGGHGGHFGGGGGGGGAGGTSFADDFATTNVTPGTSQLSQNGSVSFCWPVGCSVDADADGVPDQLDQCGPSDRSSTVVIDDCDSGVENRLDVDGCTIADRVAKITAHPKNHGQLVSGVAQLTQQLQKQGLIRKGEKQAIRRCAAAADLP